MISRLLFIGVLCFLPLSMEAQFNAIPNSISIGISPQLPEPNTEVRATLEAYSLDTSGAEIFWYLDGTEIGTARNERSIQFETNDAGLSTTVQVVATLRSGRVLDLTETIMPSRVDLIVEADTTTPSHYAGRALPSFGSTMRIVAVPDTDIDPANLTYNWQINNQQLFGGPVVGKNVAVFEAPKRNTVLIRLDITDQAGKPVARKLEEVEIVAPEILFYEYNPLRGLLRNVLTDPHLLVGPEITVRGELYYMSNETLNQNLLVEWKINNETVSNPSANQREITLRNIGGTGATKAELNVRSTSNLLQGATKSFFLNF